MKIKTILSQHRRDFTAIYECESCGATAESSGYDDTHFHTDIIPTMNCEKCGKKSPDTYRPLSTKYVDGFQI